MQQIFIVPVTAFYIHEAQKLQQPIFASSQNDLSRNKQFNFPWEI